MTYLVVGVCVWLYVYVYIFIETKIKCPSMELYKASNLLTVNFQLPNDVACRCALGRLWTIQHSDTNTIRLWLKILPVYLITLNRRLDYFQDLVLDMWNCYYCLLVIPLYKLLQRRWHFIIILVGHDNKMCNSTSRTNMMSMRLVYIWVRNICNIFLYYWVYWDVFYMIAKVLIY